MPGAKSPPLYPAANANVIAVSATDAQDKLFTASNRGGHIALAAPGARYLPAGARRKIPDDVGHLVFRRLCQRHRSADAGAQSCVEAERGARNPGEHGAAISACPGRDDLFGAGAGRCLCRGVRRRHARRRCRLPRFRRRQPLTRPIGNARSREPGLNQPGCRAWRPDKSAALAMPIGLPRSKFRRNFPSQKLKKSRGGFERRGDPCRDATVCGSGYPSPSRLYSARAPIHPKRPYGLTCPVAPRRVFIFGAAVARSPKNKGTSSATRRCGAPLDRG